jgi:hypothetical protein
MGQVWDQVMGQVWNQVRDQVGDQKLEYFDFSSYGNVSDYGWTAFYDFFDRIGINLDNENFFKFAELLKTGVYDIIQLDGLCIVVQLPKAVRRNNSGFMHSDKFPAIEWSDGYKLYYLNGVHFPEALFKEVTNEEHPIPFEKILAIVDVDQRTQAMRFGDVRKFLEHTKSEQLDKYEKMRPDGKIVHYELHRIPAGEIFRETAYYVIYDCPSTDRVYMSGVEKADNVPQAMAWKFQTTEDAWKRLIPLVTES